MSVGKLQRKPRVKQEETVKYYVLEIISEKIEASPNNMFSKFSHIYRLNVGKSDKLVLQLSK